MAPSKKTINWKYELSKELHRPARRRFPTRKTVVKGIADLFQFDLIEMGPYEEFNKGYKYIMTGINCFSKKGFAVPLKNKTGREVAQALEPILKRYPMKHMQTDLGKEFYNATVNRLLRQYNVNHYSTYSDKKASVVERYNRTLKEMMWREFTAQGNYKWTHLLQKLVNRYNRNYHRSIGMTPNQVNLSNEDTVKRRLMGETSTARSRPPRFSIGDTVRVSKVKGRFDKSYIGNWSQELFKVYSVKPTTPVTYVLEDLNGETIKGSFYEYELRKAVVTGVFFVEKILKRKGGRALVRWKGYTKDFDSWIDVKDVV
jgi:hypothetical protein